LPAEFTGVLVIIELSKRSILLFGVALLELTGPTSAEFPMKTFDCSMWSDVVGFPVPIPTHAFELITTTFEPPLMLEKRATFDPMVPELTCRVAVGFVVPIPTNPDVPKILVVLMVVTLNNEAVKFDETLRFPIFEEFAIMKGIVSVS
jgi:hypothetical protein